MLREYFGAAEKTSSLTGGEHQWEDTVTQEQFS